LRAPPPPARASAAGRALLHHRAIPSPLWLKPASRPCGSTLAGAGRRPLAIGPWCPAGLRTGVPDRRPVSPLSSSPGAVGRARAGAAGRGSPSAPCLSGARRRSEPALSCARIAGPSQCGGSPAPRGCASLGVTGLSAATQSPISMAPLWLLSRPVRRTGPAGRAEARARAAPGLAGSVRDSHRLAHRSHWAPALPPLATSPGHWRPSPPAGPCRLGCGPGEPDLAATATRGHVAPRPDS
jgi:hypothetical protein